MKRIELIVFDLDGTLYNLNDVIEMNYQMQVEFYSEYFDLDKNAVIDLFSKNDIYPTISEKSKSATEFFVKSGIPINQWNAYREKHFDVTVINKETAAHSETIKEYKAIAQIVLLSSNSTKNIKKVLDYIGVDNSLFTEIICSDSSIGKREFNKKNEMSFLSERYGVDNCSILSIGDRYKTDIEPIIELGGNGVIVSGPKDLSDILWRIKFGSL